MKLCPCVHVPVCPRPLLLVPVLLFLSLVSYLFLRSSGSAGMKAGSAWLLAMTAVRRRRKQNVLQVTVFSITIMSLLILTLLRTDLIDEWQAQIPENTPNHFMMNITQDQITGIEAFFAENGIQHNAFYPLISARVTRVNGDLPDPQGKLGADDGGGTLTENASLDDVELDEAAATAIANTQSDAAPDLNGEQASSGGTRVRGQLSRRQITWADDLPSDNLITAGSWWGEETEPGYVSIEQEYASWLDLEVGDRLEF